ncbi:MAG: hypothetical protein WCQ60_03545 [bacterium]
MLNSFKNSQFINLIIISICYIFVFSIIVSGFFFTYYADSFSQLVVSITGHFFDTQSNASIQLNGNGAAFISYYITALFILGIFYEAVLTFVQKFFKKDFHKVVEKSKWIAFLIIISTILLIEVCTAFLLNEWWLSLVGGGSFVAMFVFYAWYRFVAKITDAIKNRVQTSCAR